MTSFIVEERIPQETAGVFAYRPVAGYPLAGNKKCHPMKRAIIFRGKL